MRVPWVVASVALMVIVTSCGGDDARLVSLAGPAAAVVQIGDPGGVTILDTSAKQVLSRVDGGVAARAWVFRTEAHGAGSRISAIGDDGHEAWERTFDEPLGARIASADGAVVALMPPGPVNVDAYEPVGRASTRLVVASTQGDPDRTYDLEGNFEPEAFTIDGRSLFLVEYLPALRPDRYRVRRLELESGDVAGVPSVDGHLQESMRGTARVHAMNADASRLYTLYTTATPDGTSAFVHVLDLHEGWAHCVDLPTGLDSTPEGRLAIAAGAPDQEVVVVDAAGTVVRIDPRTLAVVATQDIAPVGEGGPVVATLGPDGELFFTRDATTVAMGADGTAIGRWTGPSPTLALRFDPRHDRLWQLVPGRLHVRDPATGEELDVVEVGGTETVRPDDGGASVIKCAC